MKIKIPTKYLLVALLPIFFFNCSKTEDLPQDIEINTFVWGGMNAYYKWQGEVPDLADTKFSSRSELNEYLDDFNAPDVLFSSLRYQIDIVDRFSWIVDDYIALENAFAGINLTSGLKLGLANYNDGSGNAYLYVIDVITGSNADIQGMTRGMLITQVNGTQITAGNVNALLDVNSFSVALADYNVPLDIPVNNGTIVNLTKLETQENPVKIATVFDNGTRKIGYLMYNQFSSSYDDELNTAFAYFQSENINDLIVDFRYNGGGSVRSATYLGSMITGQFTGEVFSRQIWNDKVMSNINNNNFINYFTDEIDNGEVEQSINSLNLTRTYFITSDRTASASELVINCLDAYIDVFLVGDQTVGKQVASVTLYDSDDYTKSGENFNASHTWAMQPIVLEIQNANNENNPDGYNPDIAILEDPLNLGLIGDISDPLIARTIQYIDTGAKGITTANKSQLNNKAAKWNSNMRYKNYNTMYTNFK